MFVAVSLIVAVASLALVADLALIISSKRPEIGMLGTMGATPATLRQRLRAAGRAGRRGRDAGGTVLGVGGAWVLDHYHWCRCPGGSTSSTTSLSWCSRRTWLVLLHHPRPGPRLRLLRRAAGRGPRSGGGAAAMSVAVRARGLTKTYQDGVRRVEVLKGIDLDVEPGELVADRRPLGLGQVDAAPSAGGARPPGRRHRRDRRPSLYRPLRGAAWRPSATARSASSSSSTSCCRTSPRWRTSCSRGGSPGCEPRQVLESARRLLPRWVWRTGWTTSPTSSRAASASGSPSAAPWPSSRRSCWPTSRRATWTRRAASTVFELLLALQARHRTTGVLVTHNPEIAARCTRICGWTAECCSP